MDEKTLIGKDVEIELEVFDLDVRQKIGKSIPELPKIQCRLIKRILTWTWNYIAELKEPLNLNLDGIQQEAQKKMTAYYIRISPSYSYKDNKKDNIYAELLEKGKVDVGVFYLEDPSSVPNEMVVGPELDKFSAATPTIGGGIVRLAK